MDGFLRQVLDILARESYPGQEPPRVVFTPVSHSMPIHMPAIDPTITRRPTESLKKLWRRILEQPADEMVKLVYADALDDATGYAPTKDAANVMSLHAEVIRLHIQHSRCCKRQWGIGHISGFTSYQINCQDRQEHKQLKRLYARKVRVYDHYRGRPVSITLAQWCAQELPVTRTPYSYVALMGGFPAALALTSPDWHLSEGAEFVNAAPVTSVRLMDRVPTYSMRGDCGWHLARYERSTARECASQTNDVITLPLWRLVMQFRDKYGRARFMADSYRWLSWACVTHARKCAKLPAIDPESLYTVI